MAKRTFADLSPYRRNVANAQQGADLIGSIISGIQGGVNLAQMPEKLEENRIAQQLQNAINLQKLKDLQNPQQALAREIEKQLTIKAALNPNSGIVRAEPGLAGETIFQPGALTFEQQASLTPESGVTTPLPSAPAKGASEVPVSAFGIQTGLNVNPNIPEQAEEDKLQRDLQKISARQKSSPAARSVTYRDLGNSIVALDSQGKEVSRIPKDVNERSQMTSRGLYVFKENDRFNGRIVPGTEPIPKSSTSSGGLKTTGEERKSFRTTISVYTSLKDLENKINELDASGKFPGGGQTFINQVLAQKPSDIPGAGLIPGASGAYAAIQQKLRSAQTPESRQYEAIRAELTANIIRAQAGLSQTSGEIENVIPYTPQANDTIPSLRDKLVNLRRISERDLNSFQMLYPELSDVQIPGFTRSIPAQESGSFIPNQEQTAPSVTPTIPTLSSQEDYGSEDAARSAGHQNGDYVIINGDVVELY